MAEPELVEQQLVEQPAPEEEEGSQDAELAELLHQGRSSAWPISSAGVREIRTAGQGEDRIALDRAPGRRPGHSRVAPRVDHLVEAVASFTPLFNCARDHGSNETPGPRRKESLEGLSIFSWTDTILSSVYHPRPRRDDRLKLRRSWTPIFSEAGHPEQ